DLGELGLQEPVEVLADVAGLLGAEDLAEDPVEVGRIELGDACGRTLGVDEGLEARTVLAAEETCGLELLRAEGPELAEQRWIKLLERLHVTLERLGLARMLPHPGVVVQDL